MVNKQLDKLVRDISGMSMPATPRKNKQPPRSRSENRQSTKQSRQEMSRGSMSQMPTAPESPELKRKIGLVTKNVIESYQDPKNDDKFCLPCTLNTARQFELDLERIQTELKAIRKQRNTLNKAAMLAAKAVQRQVKVCAKRRFPNDMRMEERFNEVANKM